MKKIVVFVLLAVFSISCKKESSQKKEQDVSYTDLLTLDISKIYKQSDFNGFSVSIVNDKGTLYQQGFGHADVKNKILYTDQTIQNIASVSKVFVGVTLLKAQELGKLKLDDPINNYLPFKVINSSYPDKAITIRHLATHTSGIVDNEFYLSKNYILKEGTSTVDSSLGFDDMQIFNPSDSIISIEEFLQNVLVQGGKWNTKETYANYKPGVMYEYSNIGTTLAAFVLEKATGERFDDFTEKHILEPLKMKDSGWSFQNVKFENYSKLYASKKTVLPFYHMITYPDGGFITSINDLSLFLTELIKGYNQKGIILNKESYREFFHPQLKEANFLAFYRVASLMFFDPKNNIGRIMILNTSFSGQKGSQDFYGIWDVLEEYQGKLDN